MIVSSMRNIWSWRDFLRVPRAAPGGIANVIIVAAVLFASAAQAQSWKPEKPVELLVGSGAGGSNDTMGRHLQRIMQEHKLVPVPVNVLNKTGGNQTLVRTYLNQHAGDAHYFELGNPTLTVNHIMAISTQHYTDFTPVALLLNEYAVFTVRADSPVRNARDLVEILKKNPDTWSVGVSNLGGTNHLTFSLLAKTAGADPKKLRVVVFKSNTEGMTAVMGGHLNMVASAVSSVIAQVRAGNARIIALGGPRRMGGALSGVPTLREQGFDIVVSNWRGIVGARGLSAAHVAYWEDVLARSVATEEWSKSLEVQFWDGNFLRSREFSKYLESDYNQTKAIMTDLGLAK
jgi:putative tricarboxylic transport membrane protein